MNLAIVVLAAGMGKRMKSDIPKVLHPVLGVSEIVDMATIAVVDAQN